MLPEKRRIDLVAISLVAACTADPQTSSPTTDSETGSSTAVDPPTPPHPPASTTERPTTTEPTTSTSASDGELDSTGEPASTGELTSTAPHVPYCGDEVVDAGEECDLGSANNDNGLCTLACKYATCGDDHIYEGVEDCDLGSKNSDAYDGCLDCKIGPHCGDGIVDEGYERCDRGELNGTGRTTDDFAPCSKMCGYYGRIMFVTSMQFKGDLGGVSGADLKCRQAAEHADFPHPGTYRAWISDDFQSPETRFDQWDLPGIRIMLPGGLVIADDLADLVDNGPRIGISETEGKLGDSVVEHPVWTNTSAFGEIFSIGDHCDNWLSANESAQARRGLNALPGEDDPNWDSWLAERWWTSKSLGRCDKLAHLYCIDDGFVAETEG